MVKQVLCDDSRIALGRTTYYCINLTFGVESILSISYLEVRVEIARTNSLRGLLRHSEDLTSHDLRIVEIRVGRMFMVHLWARGLRGIS